ncbi:hypothetical protein PR003_g27656 [Phytophthora rubi]|uniref:Uncharacterized protein n=1 Tax=Phytophthora rubi TaxID=129364 RepID=A0A6A3HU68_9STRA|nr:hypothetical protein PR002_g26570 [Phytophthora rubi]KAE8972982.1 hypothetical protein PR001_g26443 [Phytophthora rubi]KAE9281515.1 hypothetical protein PR003_g27656 [Phytophthora rubi]
MATCSGSSLSPPRIVDETIQLTSENFMGPADF